MVASAVVRAPARTNELTIFFEDIRFLLLRVASLVERMRIGSFGPHAPCVTLDRSRVCETTFGRHIRSTTARIRHNSGKLKGSSNAPSMSGAAWRKKVTGTRIPAYVQASGLAACPDPKRKKDGRRSRPTMRWSPAASVCRQALDRQHSSCGIGAGLDNDPVDGGGIEPVVVANGGEHQPATRQHH